MFHHAEDIQWHDNLVEWVRTGSIRILTISEHVGHRLDRNFRALAESNNETMNSAGYEYIKKDIYIPILDLPQKRNHTSRTLSNVAIQGSFRFDRRDYWGVYADLLASLKEHPQAWGYSPLIAPDSAYQIDETAPLQPFQLHLIGNADDPQVPFALSNVVRVHRDLEYDDFYSLIQSMDMVLPAFGSLECLYFPFFFQVDHFLILPLSADYDAKASFTMAISLECNVPILVNQWMRQTYSFIDDRVTVTRPQAVREIFAVKALRTGQWSPQLVVDNQVKNVMMAMDKMIERGWIRSADQFTIFKDEIWARNAEVVRRILSDV
ncbi:hypothetical protein PILCRDRAFT_190842 [Piloderma croceum F 1598]|uniref:Glycosyltransferase family 1 protein n=1 Tax=Piloderma croceum (strain F 1598) TaxID=765440 RepID=A0A0C3BSP7_PILCF|nr:hypothetical protein PILCRDRAFT_190842 [Piloderma croceum F 1598]